MFLDFFGCHEACHSLEGTLPQGTKNLRAGGQKFISLGDANPNVNGPYRLRAPTMLLP